MIAGNQGTDIYPSPTNYPKSSFPQPVPPPTTDPDAGTLIAIHYGIDWQSVLLAAADQLLNPATWIGDHDEIITALNRATNLKEMLQIPVIEETEVETPYWDDASDVETSEPIDSQTWYGEVTNPTAPAGELTFEENALVWIFTGLVALATPELGFAPAILFHTIAPKFLIAQKAGDVAEIWRIVIDGQDAAYVDTTGRSGEIIEVPIIPDPSLSSHDILMLSTLA